MLLVVVPHKSGESLIMQPLRLLRFELVSFLAFPVTSLCNLCARIVCAGTRKRFLCCGLSQVR